MDLFPFPLFSLIPASLLCMHGSAVIIEELFISVVKLKFDWMVIEGAVRENIHFVMQFQLAVTARVI